MRERKNTPQIQKKFNYKSTGLTTTLALVLSMAQTAHSATKGVVFSSSMKSSAIPETAYSVTEADLQNAMKKYCIPVDQFNCQPNKLAKWNKTTQKCDCVDTDGIWNPNTRECFKCQNGTYVNGYTCTPCHSATYSNWSASCGNATRTKTTYCNGINSQSDTANAKTITEKGNVGGCPEYHSCQNGSCVRTGCPAGQYLSGNSCITCPVGYYCPGDNTKQKCQKSTTTTECLRKRGITCCEWKRYYVNYCASTGSIKATDNSSKSLKGIEEKTSRYCTD